jgi:hypothetical protein
VQRKAAEMRGDGGSLGPAQRIMLKWFKDVCGGIEVRGRGDRGVCGGIGARYLVMSTVGRQGSRRGRCKQQEML